MDQVTDLLQRLAIAQARCTAVYEGNTNPLQLSDRVSYRVQIKVHSAEKSPAGQEIEAGKGDERRRLKVVLPGVEF